MDKVKLLSEKIKKDIESLGFKMKKDSRLSMTVEDSEHNEYLILIAPKGKPYEYLTDEEKLAYSE